MQIDTYYDWTWEPGKGGAYTSDTEGNLVTLCRPCAQKAGSAVSLAQRGDELSQCEACEATATDAE